MAKILIVAEIFKLGGLETNILTTIKLLKEKGNVVYFATQSTSDITIIKKEIEDVLFIENWVPLTGSSFSNSYHKIRDYLIDKNIDFVFLHPHEGMIPSAMASLKLNIPYRVIIHSPMNLSAVYGILYKKLLVDFVFPNAQSIYCVSREVLSYLENLNSNLSLKLVPNPIDTDKFAPVYKEDKNKDFYMISRLDKDKLPGLKAAIEYYVFRQKEDGLFKDRLYIVGDGEAKKDFEIWVAETYPDIKEISFIGRQDNMHEIIKEAKVVFGMGRVVLEASALNKRVILAGYDGLKGMISVENIDAFFENNFSGRYVQNVPFEEIKNQYLSSLEFQENYKLRPWIEQNVGKYAVSNILAEDLRQQTRQINNDYYLWIPQMLKICYQLKDENILDVQYLQVWLSHLDLKLSEEIRMVLGVSGEISKIKNENSSLLQQLSMVRQNLHDLNLYKDQMESELRAQIKNLNSPETIKISKECYNLNSELQTTQQKCEKLSQELQYLENAKENVEQENEKLEYLNQALTNESIDEKNKYNILISTIISKLYELSNTKFFKGLNLLKRFKHQFLKGDLKKKKKFMKWFYNKLRKKAYIDHENYNPLIELLNQLENSLIVSPTQVSTTIDKTCIFAESEVSFNSEYIAKYEYYTAYLNHELSSETKEIIKSVEGSKYKGIVIYPGAVHWEPVQRPQQILREFAQRGYLCFFVDNSNGPFNIHKVEKNLFVVSQEAPLLSWAHAKKCIVLCTWIMQSPFIDLLPDKILWYDVLDKLEFLDLYDEHLLLKHLEYVETADIVSYSAVELKPYVKNRNDALYLPNGVKLEDFNVKEVVPSALKHVLSQGKPIIGYYGAIESWFNRDLLMELATQCPQWNFVIIGKNGIGEYFEEYQNIYYFDQIPYQELLKLACHFDVGIIPFVINDITNCVSPVKFFEYQALGLPVVSTPIAEMKLHEGKYVKLAGNAKEFYEAIYTFLNEDKDEILKRTSEFAWKHQWSSRVDEIENTIKLNPRLWSVYSNIRIDDAIAVMTSSFLGFEGDNYYSGGAERYLLDLQKISKNLGYRYIVFQYGNYPWVRRFKNLDVISLSKEGNNTSVLSLETVKKFNFSYYDFVKGQAKLNIYSAFFEAWPYAASPNIGISHGVSWDSPYAEFNSGLHFWEVNRRFIESAQLCDSVVSVDSNTANWFQTINYSIGHKMQVVPNYVDLELFTPQKTDQSSEEKIVILYPRRLYEARGLYLVLDIVDEILEKYENVEFHFVGKGFDEDTLYVKKKQKKWKERVRWYWLDPDDMHEAYKKADITLVPTLYSEGTSLSCLEAMSSGNAVISTRIGGLTDLIINGYNGLLIEPKSDALKKAIIELIDSPELLMNFKQRAREVAGAFSKDIWIKKWTDVISAKIDLDMEQQHTSSRLVEIFLSSDYALNSISDLVIEMLEQGDLVYIRKNKLDYKQQSFGRLQFMPWEYESLSKADFVISDKQSKLKVMEIRDSIDLIV